MAAKELQSSESAEVRELEVVQIGEKNKGGRPPKLTEARFARMLQLIREGNTNTAVCRIERIDYSTWRDHIVQKPEWRSRLAEAEKIRDEVWRDHALEMVKSAILKNWVAAMTYLERKYPNEFALRTVNRNFELNRPTDWRQDRRRPASSVRSADRRFQARERSKSSGANCRASGPRKC
jgi:hypothetical protein